MADCVRAFLTLAVFITVTVTRSHAATISLAWVIRANINATVNQGDSVVWEWGDSFAHTLQQTGIQNPQIFTGPGTGGCGPGNNKTEPFIYRMQVNNAGRFTYNDGCNPETTLGILWVLPRPAKGPVPPLLVTIYNTTNTPPLWNSTTVVLSPPPPAPPAAAPAPAPAVAPRALANLSVILPVVVRVNSSNVTVVGLAQAPLPTGVLVPDARASHAAATAGLANLLLVLSVVGFMLTILA